MRRCTACDMAFESSAYTCPRCGNSPPALNGFVSFAPGLSDGSDSFPATAHEALDRLQDASFWFRARNALIRDLLNRFFPDAKSLLEVGCGTGYVLQGVQRLWPNIRLAGTELEVAGLSYARQRVGNQVELIQADARDLPFVDEFDVVASFDVLEHISEDEEVLGRMARVVRPGGGLLVSVPQHPWLWSKSDEIGLHKRRYRRPELAAKARAAGWEVLYQTSFLTLLLPAMILQRLGNSRRTNYDGVDELALPSWLDGALERVTNLERLLIRFGRLPVGGSRFVVARRPCREAA